MLNNVCTLLPEEFQWKEKEILVIEDEISDYVSLEEILKGRIKINYVDSPARALEFCSINHNVDLCLYHWHPDKDLGFIDEIRKMKKELSLVLMKGQRVGEKPRAARKSAFDLIIALSCMANREVLHCLIISSRAGTPLNKMSGDAMSRLPVPSSSGTRGARKPRPAP